MFCYKIKNLEPKFIVCLNEKDSNSFIQFQFNQNFKRRSSLDLGINIKQNFVTNENIENKIKKVENNIDSYKTQRVSRQVFMANLNQSQEIRQQASALIPRILSKKKSSCQSSRKKSQNLDQYHSFLPNINIQKAKQFLKSDQQSNNLKFKTLSNQNHMKIYKRTKSMTREKQIMMKQKDNLNNSRMLLDT